MDLRGFIRAALVVISFGQAGTLWAEIIYTYDPPSLDSVSDFSIDMALLKRS
jgi:hypothetical protein